MKIPFSPPYIDVSVENEVIDVLRSGWITTGKKVQALEQELVDFAGVQKCLCVNSATSGMMLALHWFGVSRGDEVIIPAYTYAATALAVMHIGAIPVMVDCGVDSNIDVSQIKQKISSKTKAIIPVDIGGWPCTYDALNQLVNDPEIKLLFQPKGNQQIQLGRILILSDAAHSIGSLYRKEPTARHSDLTVYSFHAVKNVTTAEGGAILLNLPEPFDTNEIYKTLRLWSLNGQTKDALTKSTTGGWKYDIVYPGFKMNMPDLLAAVGLAQLRQYNHHLLESRFKVAEQFRNIFSTVSWAELPEIQTEDKSSSCHLFALRIKDATEQQRDAMIEYIEKQGVSVNVHFIPLPMLTVFRERGYAIENYPNAYQQYAKEISLPIYPQLTNEQIEYIGEVVKDAYSKVINTTKG